jgi:mRNA interferase RelE/StbE
MAVARFGVAYTVAALGALKKIPQKFRKQIVGKIQALANEPLPSGCKKLHNETYDDYPVFRIRSGNYRILYCVKGNPDQIVVLDIGDRKEIYR